MKNFEIKKIENSEQKSLVCGNIIKALPQWFGIAEENDKYVSGVQNYTVFVCNDGGSSIGLIALKPHLKGSVEIWWMGVHPDYHRKNIGYSLFQSACEYARLQSKKYMIVNTISERSVDEYYARTREFYLKIGFVPLFEEKEDEKNPMMWMLLSL